MSDFQQKTDLTELEKLQQENVRLASELQRVSDVNASFQSLFVQISIPYQSLNSQGVVLEVNDAWLRRFGYEREEVLGRGIGLFLQPGQEEILKNRFHSLLVTGCVSGCAYDFKCKNGSTASVIVEGRSCVDDSGNRRTHCLLLDMPSDCASQSPVPGLDLQRLLFEHSPSPTIVVDPEDGSILDVNVAALKIYGYTHDEMTGLNVSDITRDLSRERMLQFMVEVVASGALRNQFVHLTKSGKGRDVEVHSSVAMQGRRPLVYSTIIDITEQEKAKRSSRKLSNLLAGILDNATAIVTAKDLSGRHLFMSKWGERFFRFEEGQVQGKTDVELFDSVTAEAIALQDEQVMQSQRPMELQSALRVRGREYAFLHVKFPLLDENGSCLGIGSISTDVTEFQKATEEVEVVSEQVNAMNEQLVASNSELQNEIERRISIEGELREREVLLRSIFRAVPIGIGLVKNEVFHWTNVTFQEMVGRSSEELEGMDTRLLYATEADYKAVGEVLETARHHGVGEVEVKALTRNGDQLDVVMHMALIHPEDDDGGMVFSCMNVTERNRVQHELRMEKDRAEIASRTKNEFLANMSHEIRTPLNGVMGMLQLLETTGLDEEQEDYVATALGSSRGLLTILNDILDLSIIEAGKMDLRSEVFCFESFILDVVKVFRHQAEGKNLTLSAYVHPGVSMNGVGDRGRLRQVLFNLLGNAIKFTPEGEVSVEVYPLPCEEGDKVRVLFVVDDTGIGIAKENLDEVFETFTQVDGSFTRDFQGTGLGLGIVKRLVELMGGSVQIGSVLGRGTSIHFCLPFDVVDEAQCVPDDPLLIRRFPSGTRVLVVEDSRPNSIMVSRFLTKLGVEAMVAENGVEALKVLEQSDAFDCILMDVQMPIMDGMEATRRIRAGQCGPSGTDVPIVALTAHAMKGDREMFLESGMDNYLSKPIDIVDLGNLLSRLIRSGGKPSAS